MGGGREPGVLTSEGVLTDPAIARRFVEETHVDSLAVSVGTAHGLAGDVRLDLIGELRAATRGRLVVDVKANGTADFTFRRSGFRRIVVNGGGGGDTLSINESRGAFTNTEATTLNGQNGNDKLVGGSFNERLNGGSGNDTIYGQGGDDHIYGDNGINVDQAYVDPRLLPANGDIAGVPGVQTVWCQEVGGARMLAAGLVGAAGAEHAERMMVMVAAAHEGGRTLDPVGNLEPQQVGVERHRLVDVLFE